MEKILPANITMNFSYPVGYTKTKAIAAKLLENANKLSEKLLDTDQLEINYKEISEVQQGFEIKILRRAEDGLKEKRSAFLNAIWPDINGVADFASPNDGVKLAKKLIKESKPTNFQKLVKLATNIIKR